MSDSSSIYSTIRQSMGFRLMVLFVAFFVAILLSAAIGGAFSTIEGFPQRYALLSASAVQCVLAFCLPAWATAKFASSNPAGWLSIRCVPTWKSIVGVVIVYLLAMPAMNQLIDWNQGIHFPESLSSLEQQLRASEDAASAISEKMLGNMTLASMLLTVLVVGLLTGFSEEIFFRGAMQKIFLGEGSRKALAIWGSAVIFSAIHFQFFGFFPRLLMGAFFGYLLVWTRSLWVPVFAHALNNSIVVAATWLTDSGRLTEDAVTVGVSSAGEIPWGAIASVVATTIFLWRFRGYFFR